MKTKIALLVTLVLLAVVTYDDFFPFLITGSSILSLSFNAGMLKK